MMYNDKEGTPLIRKYGGVSMMDVRANASAVLPVLMSFQFCSYCSLAFDKGLIQARLCGFHQLSKLHDVHRNEYLLRHHRVNRFTTLLTRIFHGTRRFTLIKVITNLS